jgi:acetolactate synthase-1/2/3 large subunit
MKLSDYGMGFASGQGVGRVLLPVGGGAMHWNDSLARCQALRYVCNQPEQASAVAARKYAKFCNQLGVAMVTTGPGGTNAITGVTHGMQTRR